MFLNLQKISCRRIIGVVGSKHMEYLPDIIPCLLHLLNDEAPPVVRQAIKTGTTLFAKLIQRLVIQGLFSTGGIDDALKSSWEWLLKFKSAVSLMAFQTTGNEGVRLLAVKFVEKTVLMYTPDPNIPSDPTSEATKDMGFNIAWLRGGHPLLNVGDLAMEASQNLGLLLEQLKSPKVKSLSTSMIIVFITSLSAIAQRRPSFYGRILPVLLSLDPASSIIKLRVPGAFHALKSAFSACLECTHSSAEPVFLLASTYLDTFLLTGTFEMCPFALISVCAQRQELTDTLSIEGYIMFF